jgi:integrase
MGKRNDATPERAHRPDELGSVIFKRGPFYAIDLRWLGGGRPTMKNPDAPGWPEYGERTDNAVTARRWRSRYEEYFEAGDHLNGRSNLRKFDSLGVAADAFIEDRAAQHGNTSSTVSGTRTAMKHLQSWFGSAKNPRHISGMELQERVNKLAVGGYEPLTIHGYVQHIELFFDWMGGYNPAVGLKLPQAVKKLKEAWLEGARANIRRAAVELDAEADDSWYYRLLVELLFATGMRIQEAAAARWDWFDRKAGVIQVKCQVSRSGEETATKGRAARLAAVLDSWWAVHDKVPERSGRIIHDGRGGIVRHTDLSKHVAEVLERAKEKSKGERAHKFRHTYSFLLLSSGVSMEELSACLGHTSIRTTQNYYDHWSPTHAARSAANKIRRRRRKKG